MNKYEALDQGFQLVSNGNFALPLTYLLSKGIDRIQRALNRVLRVPASTIDEASPAVLWTRLAKEFFLFGNIIAFMQGIPGIRNAMMISVSKTTRFVDMVGLNGTKEEPESVRKAEIQKNIRLFLRNYCVGLGITGSLALVAQLAAWRRLPVPKLLQSFHHHLGLPQGRYEHLKDWAAVLFWAYPVYSGYYMFSRDEAERREILVKALGFGLAFAVIPRTIERVINAVCQGKRFPLVGPGENLAFLGQIVSGCLAYTAIPTFTNLVMRRSRAEKLGLLKTDLETPKRISLKQSFVFQKFNLGAA
jgi:hypothetical protein